MTKDFDLKASVIGRRTKKAIDRVVELNDVMKMIQKPRYRKIGGMKLLDRDRKLAHAAMRREFASLARLTLIRSRRKTR
jgi:hypothetical protein